jgi:hypothetical protein
MPSIATMERGQRKKKTKNGDRKGKENVKD